MASEGFASVSSLFLPPDKFFQLDRREECTFDFPLPRVDDQRAPRIPGNSGANAFPSGSLGELRRHLFSSFTANLVVPIFSLFVPLLAQKLGADVFEIGVVGGASNAVYSFMPFVMGHFSDRRGARKFFIASSFSILSVVSISYVLASTPLDLIIAKVFEGVGWAMLWPAIEAAISNDVSPRDSKRALGLFNFTWSGAAAIGPIVGSALIYYTTLRDAFVFTALIMLITLGANLLPFFSRRFSRTGPQSSAGELVSVEVRAERNPWRADNLERTATPTNPSRGIMRGSRFFVVCTSLAAVSSGVLFTFFAPFANSFGFSVFLVGVVTFAFGFGRFLMYVLAISSKVRNSLLREETRTRNVVLALILMSASSLAMLVHDTSGLVYLAAYAVVGIGYSVVYAISQAVLVAESSPESVGRSAGIFESAIGVGGSLGPVIAGAISGGSLSIPFVLPSLSLLVLFSMLPFLRGPKS